MNVVVSDRSLSVWVLIELLAIDICYKVPTSIMALAGRCFKA